ncbi:retinol dehydrogenase 13 [Ophiostoma piceae UAMH 11346]|uniref:Retinol dehydrogenase 13 n=1 Tax=Ophiostoma piceae (strain UAMH 11346) TaxID=1262450 RepID=S3C8A5_OPHP1|nr:retinol dehydrogenase 13 [Ophiostoma piceae UAMH 11346]
MASHSEFGKDTTATEVASVLGDSIKGRTVVLTGVSPASIGYTTALAIASQGPVSLVLASRTPAKLDAVVRDIKKVYPSAVLHTVLLDLSSTTSIHAAAVSVAALAGHVDVLINNAGVSTPERHPVTAPDGTELDTQFMTNHLGVFLWTALLLPLLKAALSARIVNISSQGHRLSPVRFSDYAFRRGLYDVPDAEKPAADLASFFTSTVDGYAGFLGYGQSKSANILHAIELSRRLSSTGIRSFSVHPGTIETELSRSLDKEGQDTIAKTAPKGFWKTQDQGAATTMVAAFDPALAEVDMATTVGYLSDCQLRDDMVGVHAQGKALATRLWTESERLLKYSVVI